VYESPFLRLCRNRLVSTSLGRTISLGTVISRRLEDERRAGAPARIEPVGWHFDSETLDGHEDAGHGSPGLNGGSFP
jgi:hypothetical protein